jgi:hypothetical protein
VNAPPSPRSFPLPLPERMRRLPVDARGYPVPWFVAWFDAAGHPCERGTGTPDFRVVMDGAPVRAYRDRVCWICGEALGAFQAFVIGPMCAVNRVSSEPGSHLECANFSARVCPFLTNPERARRTSDMPAGSHEPAGCGIARNPGVALVWSTKRAKPFSTGNGFLFELGEPAEVFWWAEGRKATRAEVQASMDSGLPALAKLAEVDGPAGVAELATCVRVAQRLLPAEAT